MTNKSKTPISFENITVVKEFLDVFCKELESLPLEREVEFNIEVVYGTSTITKALNRMTPKDLLELKVQWNELLDKGFIRLSVSL